MLIRSLLPQIVFSGSVEGGGGDPAPAADPAPAPAADPAPAPAADPAAPEGVLDTSLLNVDPTKQADPAADPNKPADPAADPAKKDEPPVALDPKDYKLDNLPEGITADDELVQAFLDGAAKGGMDNDSVNAVIGALAPKLAERLNAGAVAFKTLNEKWQADAIADPVIGGSKEKLEANMGVVVNAMNTLGLPQEMVTDALRTFTFTGAGNNPSILRVMHAMASRLVEKTVVQGNGPAPVGKTAAQRLYPTHFNNAG